MSTHIEAKKGEIVESVLMPGDPMRAKYIAENFLSDIICYNNVRGMLGFSGVYHGKRVSVQGSGMGMPSISIYVNELLSEYKVNTIIRVGTCGAFSEKLNPRDIVLAMSCCTDSSLCKRIFKGLDYAPTASFSLLKKAAEIAENSEKCFSVGTILSTDTFYQPDPDMWKIWRDYGVLAVEMETAALYTYAAKYKANALSILTVSDSLVTGNETTSNEREKTFSDMVEIALKIL
ncbi:MAG: purine-nucleoside phosphorylase [Bacillota bacterium]|nr:purine-nucleoside phosphorylase [Bacillota bacterium]